MNGTLDDNFDETRAFEGEYEPVSDADYLNVERQFLGYDLPDREESRLDFIDPFDNTPTVMEPFGYGDSAFL